MPIYSDFSVFPAVIIIFILSLFILLLVQVGKHLKSNIYLTVYFFSQIIGVVYFTFLPYYHGRLYLLFLCFGQSIVMLWGALFYFFYISLLNPNFRITGNKLWHFSPAVLTFIFILIRYNPHLDKIPGLHFVFSFSNPVIILSAWFNVLIIIYMFLAIIKYRHYLKDNQPELTNRKMKQTVWLKIVLYGFVISSSLVILNNIFIKAPENMRNYHFLINYSIFLLYFSVLFYLAVAKKILFEPVYSKEKYKGSNLTQKDADQLLQKLEYYMGAVKPFTDPDLKLNSLAAVMNISSRHLSQLINEYKNQNFSDFVNHYRVKLAMELLGNENNSKATIFSILLDVGFNSKTTFNLVFKRQTGLTPSQYKSKMLRKSS